MRLALELLFIFGILVEQKLIMTEVILPVIVGQFFVSAAAEIIGRVIMLKTHEDKKMAAGFQWQVQLEVEPGPVKIGCDQIIEIVHFFLSEFRPVQDPVAMGIPAIKPA